MAIKLNCLESLTAIGIGVGACALAPLDAGLTAGAVIGGAGLFARIRENSRKAGLDDAALVARMQKVILREWDHWQDTQERRDAVTLADAGMTRLLPQVMLTREELAATATESPTDRYPAMAAKKVVDRLGEKDPSFAILADGSEPLARQFALEVLERALKAAKEDKDYAAFLTLDIAIELGRAMAENREALARIAEQNQATHDKLDALPDTLRQIVVEALGPALARGLKEDEVIALARRVEPTVQSIDEAVAQLASVIDAYVRLRDAAERGTNFGDIVDAALREIADRNAAQQYEAGLRAGERAFAALGEQEAALKAAKAAMAQANSDQARIVGDAEASARWIVEGLEAAGDADFDGIAGRLEEYCDRGLIRGVRFDLEIAVALATHVANRAANSWERGAAANWLGIAASNLGDRTGGSEGLRLLEEAVAAYRDALTVYTLTDLPTDWGTAQNNLGNAIQTQGERIGGGEGLRLLNEAVAAYRDALTVYTRAGMPVEWATTQNNLGGALLTQGSRTGGPDGLHLLNEAIAAYRDALTVRTRAEMPAQWSATQNNLGNALRVKGERTGGAEGLRLLDEAAVAYREVLTVFTLADMPARWALTQNNLGTVLQAQGARTRGAEGLRLHNEAVAAYRDALTVRTKADMPVDWAMTQTNLGNALASQGLRTGGAEGLSLLHEAIAAYRDALTVRTRAEMPVDWALTQENLGLTYEGRANLGCDSEESLHLAETAFLASLDVYTPEHMPYDYGTATASLARVREKLAALGG